MIELQDRPRIVRATSYIVALGGAASGVNVGDEPGAGRTVTAPPGRQPVPAGPFAVLRGSAVVEFDGDDSLVYLRSGMVCDFAPGSGASWVVAERLTVQEVTRCPWSEAGETETGLAA